MIEELAYGVCHEPPTDEKICRGTLLSRQQYLPDLNERGYLDARLPPHGPMRAEDVKHWTDAIGKIR